MHTLARRLDTEAPHEIDLPSAGHQWLPVSARIVERYLVSFRAPAAKLVSLVPPDGDRRSRPAGAAAPGLQPGDRARPRHGLAARPHPDLHGRSLRDHDLPFHITRLGRGPHWGLRTERVEDWLTLLELRYELTATPAGARLTRHTTWRRHLAPGFYFGWLQQKIIGRGQARLLELIRARVGHPSSTPSRRSAQAAVSGNPSPRRSAASLR